MFVWREFHLIFGFILPISVVFFLLDHIIYELIIDGMNPLMQSFQSIM